MTKQVSDCCEHRKDWWCELDDGYCGSNIQIGELCPNYKPCTPVAKEEK